MISGNGKFKARIFDSTEIQTALNRIAHEILDRNPEVETLVLVGIRRRGVPLAQRLAAIIRGIEGKSISTAVLDITLYRDDMTPVASDPIVRKKEVLVEITDKTIILVDDVLYTGRTIWTALDALYELGRPRSVQLAVLLDRGHRMLPIHADYVGKTVPTASNEIVHVFLKEIDHDEQVIITEKP